MLVLNKMQMTVSNPVDRDKKSGRRRGKQKELLTKIPLSKMCQLHR